MKPSLIQLLRSNSFAIYIAIASVLVQSFHSFYAFYKISSLNGSYWGIAQAALFALIVDCAVLFYTVRKNTKVTWMFAFVMVLINLYVYYTHLGLTFDFILGILISFVIPVSNYFYSEEIDDIKEIDYEDNGRLNAENISLRNKLDDARHEQALASEGIKSLKEERDQIWKERNEFLQTIESKEKFIESESIKSTNYITELREEIKKRDEQLKKMVPLDNPMMREAETIAKEDGDYIKSPVNGELIKIRDGKGFASLKSPAQEEQPRDKSILNVEKIIATDRPNP